MARPLFILLTLLLTSLAARSADELPADAQKLIGHWQYEAQGEAPGARYDFRPDGSFTAELYKGDEVQRTMSGQWKVEEGMIVYTYESDSLSQIASGARERDRLIRVDESSYTIQGGDGGQRTYWRMKEEK